MSDLAIQAKVRSTNDEIGVRIRRARDKRRWTQERLGEVLGVTFQQVQKYELGKNRVSACTLIAIAEALDTDITFFLPSPTAPVSRAELADAKAMIETALETLDRTMAELAGQRQRLLVASLRVAAFPEDSERVAA